MATEFSAPPSEHDVSILNVSGSSGSTVATPPTQKHQFTPAELALVNATPAVPALVATSQNVQLHNAIQIQVSSGSKVSVTSSTERQRRVDLARAKRELAEARASEAEATASAEREVADARVSEAQAEPDSAAGSPAGSVGRLNDVQSEGGSIGARRVTRTTRPTPSNYSTVNKRRGSRPQPLTVCSLLRGWFHCIGNLTLPTLTRRRLRLRFRPNR